MSLLDNIRPLPRWRHSDPAVRLAAIEELEDDQQELLRSMVRDDTDVRVRVAAVGRLTDPSVLAEIAAHDSERRVHTQALEMLIGIATREDEPERCATALAGITEAKQLARIARTASRPAIRREALARLDTPLALGSVARHAGDPQLRAAAVGRIDDPHELASVALKSEHEDAAHAAIERLQDRDALATIARKARDPEVGRRAAARLESLTPVSPEIDIEAVRAERAELCHRLEFLTHTDSWDRLRAEMGEVEERWARLEPAADGELKRRFAAARESVAGRLGHHESDLRERDRQQQDIDAAIAARQALCETIAACEGPAVPERLEETGAAWAALGRFDHPEVARLEARFEAARRSCRNGYDAWKAEHARRTGLEAICLEVERLLEAEGSGGAERRWQALRREWKELGPGDDPELTARFERVVGLHDERRDGIREERLRRETDNLNRVQQLCENLEGRVGAESLTIKEADQGQREARAALDAPGPFPTPRDKERVLDRMKAIRAAFGTRIRELREIGEWKRWANSGVAEELCGRLESLVEVPDIKRVARQLRDIDRLWRQARALPKDQAEALKLRFDKARSTLQARCDQFLARQGEEWSENLQHRTVLCEKAEAMAESTDWIRTAEEIKKLQAEWRAVGPVARDQSGPIWQRFRAPCDRFFARRKADLETRKKAWSENAARKEGLCQRAEELASSSDWDAAVVELKRLQAEWKTVGSVRRSRSDALWKRFRAGCDRFFERYRQREKIDLANRIALREGICAELEALVPSGGVALEAEQDGFVESVIALQRRWDAAGGAVQKESEDLWKRYADAMQRAVLSRPDGFRDTELDFEATHRKMEQLCSRIEAALSTVETRPIEGASPAAILAMQLREALAANTIGGRVDSEARWKPATAEVKESQAAWRRLGPAPDEKGAALARRFNETCRRFYARRPAQERAVREPARRRR